MLKLSNSSLESFFTCPQLYAHRYISGWKQAATPSFFDYGTRMHELLQGHYCPTATNELAVSNGGVAEAGLPPTSTSLTPELELEAQAMFAAYQASYPAESFDVVACEIPFELAIATDLHYIGRIDMLVRDKASRKLMVFETKTESRGSKRNLPEAWVARHQGSLYAWAASQVFGEPIDSILLNILTRGTPGKQIGPKFRRDLLHRSQEQIDQALSDLRYVAKQVAYLTETEQYEYEPREYATVYKHRFPRNTSVCVSERGFKCTYYGACHMNSYDGLVQLENPYSYLSSSI